MKIKLFVCLLIIFFAHNVNAEERSKFGLFGGLNYNLYQTDFRALPGVPSCCPKFSTGNGLAYLAGITIDVPLFNSLYIGSNIGFHSLNGQLKSIESTTIFYNDAMNTGKFQHTIDVTMSVISFEPKIGYRLFDAFFVNAGFGLYYPIRSDYSQEERIIDPQGQATFLDEFGNDTKSMIRN